MMAGSRKCPCHHSSPLPRRKACHIAGSNHSRYISNQDKIFHAGYNCLMKTSKNSIFQVVIVGCLLVCASCSKPPEDPDFFTARTPLPSCGEAKITNASKGNRFESSQIDCMRQSRTSGGSEFTMRSTTTEGDEIVDYIRVLPDSVQVEVIVDNSQDEYSKQGWTSYSCSIPEITEESITECMTTR